ncbi:hypothetical protein B0H16DRAFT_1592906 [Mycena metata]|uniref:MYND-type domain-containing protein n=1 Tax=Mycena metata TaxID=1033252 RepID=A0AAD7MP35_9AGAR|nr:hypothetical protein B0H16DRAFT_1592906 [Mycena metata]
MPRSQNASTEEERDLLFFTLSNPTHEDACCVLALSGILDKVLGKEDSRQGPLLRAAMSFLATDRGSDKQHSALQERLKTCQCKPKIRMFHESTTLPSAELLEKFLWTLCIHFADYLTNLGPGKFRKAKQNLPADAQAWPTCIEDVIPVSRTETDVLVSIVRWAANYPGGHSVFALLAGLARFLEPFAQALFQVPVVFLLATRHLQCALQAYDPHVDHTLQMNTFASPLIACTGLFHEISTINMPSTMDILAKIYEELYPVAVRMEPILRSMTDQRMSVPRSWFRLVRSMRDSIGTDGTLLYGEGPPLVLEPRVCFAGAFQLMTEMRNRNQCLHLACTARIVSRTSMCSRCGIVRYCSHTCLAAAWTAPHLPHKTLCKAIRGLRAATHLVDDKAWSHTVRDSARSDPTEFIGTCTVLAVDMRTAKAVIDGLWSLGQAKRHSLQTTNGDEDESYRDRGREQRDVPDYSNGVHREEEMPLGDKFSEEVD